MLRHTARYGILAGVFWCLLLLFAPCAAAQEAVPLPGVQLLLSGAPAPASLQDGSIYTWHQAKAGDTLQITAEQPIAALFLKFSSEPQPYTMQAGEKTFSCGQNAFLHELVQLPTPQQSVTLSLPQTGLCEIVVYGEGTLPATVQRWQPGAGACDMLVFPTHADDDTLFFGPLIAETIHRGHSVQVAYLVHHKDTVDRPHELLDGLWAMGVKRYPVIGDFPDVYSESLAHAETIYDTEAVLAYQIEQLRRFRPKVVVGHDEAGEYGHGVHMLNTHLLKQAVQKSEDAAAFPESAQQWGVHAPQKTYLHLYENNSVVLNVHARLERWEITPFELAKIAYKHHHSQQKWVFAVADSGYADCRLFGLYQSAVGEDTGKNDVFENVVLAAPLPEGAPQSAPAETPQETPPAASQPQKAPEQAEPSAWRGAAVWAAAVLGVFAAALLGYRLWAAARRRKKDALKK